MRRHARRTAGFTMIETVIATAILGTVFGAVYSMLDSSSRSFTVASRSTRLDTRAIETLDRIADLLRASKISTITPQQASPFSSSRLDLQRSVGYAGGATQWGNPERILATNGTVQWIQNLGSVNQSTTILARGVPTYLERETANGEDDNGNGLVDESGLCFDVAGTSVVVRLTLEARSSTGELLAHTAQQRVFLRNR